MNPMEGLTMRLIWDALTFVWEAIGWAVLTLLLFAGVGVGPQKINSRRPLTRMGLPPILVA